MVRRANAIYTPGASVPSTSVHKMEFQQAVTESVQELGYRQLRPKQLEALQAFVVDKRDVFAVLPTGYGKSVMYGILPTLSNKLRGIISNCREIHVCFK